MPHTERRRCAHLSVKDTEPIGGQKQVRVRVPSTHIRVPVNNQFACIPMAAIHIDTSSVRVQVGYLWISLVRAVSVLLVFLSNSYEVNNTKFVLI